MRIQKNKIKDKKNGLNFFSPQLNIMNILFFCLKKRISNNHPRSRYTNKYIKHFFIYIFNKN